MMLVIRPPGRWTRTGLSTGLGLLRATLFTAAAALGATLVLTLAWAVGSLLSIPPVVSYSLLAVTALALAARDAGLARFRLPQRRGQVKRETMLEHPVAGLVAHGFALGTAFYTFIPISLTYLVFVMPLAGTLAFGSVLGLGMSFAFGRSLPVFIRMFLRNIDADQLAQELMTRGLPLARTISVVTLGVVAGALARDLVRLAQEYQ